MEKCFSRTDRRAFPGNAVIETDMALGSRIDLATANQPRAALPTARNMSSWPWVGITRACRQLSQMTAPARWMAARKLRAVLSLRVAIARCYLSLAKTSSIRCRSL